MLWKARHSGSSVRLRSLQPSQRLHRPADAELAFVGPLPFCKSRVTSLPECLLSKASVVSRFCPKTLRPCGRHAEACCHTLRVFYNILIHIYLHKVLPLRMIGRTLSYCKIITSLQNTPIIRCFPKHPYSSVMIC